MVWYADIEEDIEQQRTTQKTTYFDLSKVYRMQSHFTVLACNTVESFLTAAVASQGLEGRTGQGDRINPSDATGQLEYKYGKTNV